MPSHRSLHPLLFEARYWRSRLRDGSGAPLNPLLFPREDLSHPGCEVRELRFHAHDGVRLWGLLGRCPLFLRSQPARLRVVSPSEHPKVDADLVEQGTVDLALQGLPGRRLEDRVMDVVRFWQAARQIEGIDAARIRLDMPSRATAPDEFLIVEELWSSGLCP